MILELSDEILHLTGMSEQELKLELAITLYKQQKLTLGQASHLANLGVVAFQFVLGKKGIAVNYDEEALEADWATIKKLKK